MENQDFGPAIRRARFDQLTLYEISDNELEILARGSPASTFLNFAIGLASAFVSCVTALLTTTMGDRTFTVFVVVASVSGITAAVLFFLWNRERQSLHDVVAQIRRRLPPEGAPVAPVVRPDL
jgi:hypothetical protein